MIYERQATRASRALDVVWWLLLAGIFLLGGLITSVLQVWITPEVWPLVTFFAGPSSTPPAVLAPVLCTAPGGLLEVNGGFGELGGTWDTRWAVRKEDVNLIPTADISSFPPYVEAPASHRGITFTHATGWPCVCLVSYIDITASPLAITSRGTINWNDHHSPLPFIPIWPGLVLNSMFYGAMLVGMWAGFGALRRRRRIRRGRCASCGYSRVGVGTKVVCPECGALPHPHLKS